MISPRTHDTTGMILAHERYWHPDRARARALTARRLRVMHYFRDLLDQHRRLNGAILTVTPLDRRRP